MAKAEYKSARRSREAIVSAFLLLAEEKPVSKITVTDIAAKAEIGRGTFYTHYEDMDDLIRQLEEYAVNELTKVLTDMKRNFNNGRSIDVLLGMADSLEKNRALNALLFSSDDVSIMTRLRTCFADYMMDNDAIPAVIRANPKFNAMIQFFAGGAANLCRAWFKGEIGGTLEDIAYMLNDTILLQAGLFKEDI